MIRCVQPRRAEERLAHRRRSTGQRRLRADRQDRGGPAQHGRDLGFAGRREQLGGVPARRNARHPRGARRGCRGRGRVRPDQGRPSEAAQQGMPRHGTILVARGVAILLRTMRFAPEYVAYVLNENFEDAKDAVPVAAALDSLRASRHAGGPEIVSPADAQGAARRRSIRSARPMSAASPTTAPARICSITSSGSDRRRAARTPPDGCTRREAATTST